MAADPSSARTILAPMAIGELIDKITILEIKAQRLLDPNKLRNVSAELALLRDIRMRAGLDGDRLDSFAAELRNINMTLWDVEDALRACEARADFGPHFVELARSVYRTNDRRSAVKKKIDLAFGSAITEEKSYGHL
jgi:hypothetical protein